MWPRCNIHAYDAEAARRQQEAADRRAERLNKRRLLENAAEDLLTACRELLAEVDCGRVGLLNTHPDKQRDSLGVEWIRAAIAKSEGR